VPSSLIRQEGKSMKHIGTFEVEHESTVLVYHPDSGDILHYHHVVTMRGGKHPDKQTLEKHAMAQFSQAQPHITTKMAALHVKSSDIRPNAFYRVDTANQSLVEVSKPQRSSRPSAQR
jgi:hypothetical protein